MVLGDVPLFARVVPSNWVVFMAKNWGLIIGGTGWYKVNARQETCGPMC